MTKSLKVFSYLFCILLLNSCGILWNIKYDCRDYVYNEEEYWFPEYAGNIIAYENRKGEIKEFILEEKSLNHTTSYKSDTGCGCEDISKMLLRDGDDTFLLLMRNFYIYDRSDSLEERITITINGETSIFDYSHVEYKDNITIDNKEISNLKIYYAESARYIQRLVLAKGIGIIKYSYADGEEWNLKYINKPKTNFRMTFEYSEGKCKFNGQREVGIHFDN